MAVHASLDSFTVALFENLRVWVASQTFSEALQSVNVYQLAIDAVLLLFTLWLFLRKPEKLEKPLTEKEIRSMIDEWEPDPLVPLNYKTPLTQLDEHIPLISKTTATHVEADGKMVLNLARTNFLGMIGNPRVEDAAIKTVSKYGVGTCGPRGFSGTIDVHLDLETRIKKFLSAQDCVIYSYGFATISSVIPAFAGRGDLLIVDKGVNYPIQTGVTLSRCDALWFNHNDMADLERVLQQVKKEDERTKRNITRRYIIIEGVYFNFGDVAPLDKIVELKKKYAWRLMMDDSCGIGTLGRSGRGTCEFFNIPAKEVDFLTGDLSTITGSVGGFCCGSQRIVYHQRLNSSGYVYSASLPPLLAVAAHVCFDIIDEEPQILDQLKKNLSFMYKGLSSIDGIQVTSIPESALIHVRLASPPKDRGANEAILQRICDEAFASGVFLTRAKYVHGNEEFLAPPSIRVAVSVAHSAQQLDQAVKVIRNAVAVSVPNSPSSASVETPSTEEKRRSTRRSARV